MPWKIKHKDGKHLVVNKDTDEVVGEHPTHEKAVTHLRALYANADKGHIINLFKSKEFKLQGRIPYRGLDIAIENRKGSVRKGTNEDGEEWATRMFYPYGYIRGTMGVDGDPVDVFVGPIKDADYVYVIHQVNPETKKYDEDKVMLGFDDEFHARDAYLAHYDTHEFLGEISKLSFDEFKKKALATKEKPKMIKAFGKLLKAIGAQLGIFGGSDQPAMEGEIRVKDGKTYQVKRSKKNPQVKRIFRADKEESKLQQPKIFEQPITKPKPQFGQKPKEPKYVPGKIISNKKEFKRHREEKARAEAEVKQKEEPFDLFSQPKDEKRSTKKDNPLDQFGVTHLDQKIRQQRIEINNKVRELLASKSDDEMTPEDLKLLATYSGRGGTDQVSLNEYYTPDYVAKFQWDILHKLGFRGGSVLEPSCGTGVFLHTAPENALVTAVEFDETSGRIAGLLFPDHQVYNMSFEQYNTGEFDKGFDASIGNVPFGPRGETAIHDRDKIRYNTHEQYFLDRIIDNLNEGGVASIIVPTGIMDNQITDYRLELNKKAEFLGAIRMPTGVFKKANAQVTTDIVFFRKRPDAVIERLQEMENEDELGKLYDSMVLDVEFVNGTYFAKNPEYALGEEDTANFGRKIWKGDITPEDLYAKGELLKLDDPDYSILGELGIVPAERKELQVGDLLYKNGRTYRLNENHRWERLDTMLYEQVILPKEIQDLVGIKTAMEARELAADPSRLMKLSREQLKALDEYLPFTLTDEIGLYTSSNLQKDEMMKEAVILGLAVKQFQKTVQTGRPVTVNGTTQYEAMSSSDAQMEAQKLAMMLEDFKERYGHPLKDAKLNTQLGKSRENPMLYVVSSFDAEGNLTKLFTDPMGYYNVYYPKWQAVTKFDPKDLMSIVRYYKENGLPVLAESLKSDFHLGNTMEIDEFKKMLLQDKNIFIDENGEYDSLNEVCVGTVYNKLDYWEQRLKDNNGRLNEGNLTQREREYLVAENKKLDEQIFELKQRAGIRTLENLPVDMSDAGKFFDVKHLDEYLQLKLLNDYKGQVIYSEDRRMFTFSDKGLNNTYTLWIAGKSRGLLSKEEKSDLEDAMQYYFGKEKNPLMLLMLNQINGLSSGNVADSAKQKVKEIEEGFVKYLGDAVPNREEIENKYNREYNNFIQKEYDGSVIEGLKKLDYDKVVAYDKEGNPIKVKDKIASYNWSVVRRMYEQGKGLIAHGVGLGKTLEAILVGMLAKENGQAKKPTYVVPKSVIGNWKAEIEKWTKDTNILMIGAHRKEDKNGNAILDENGKEIWVEDNAQEKKLKLAQLANGEFDFVLMTRDFYSSISMTPQSAENMLNELVTKFYVSTGDENDKAAEKKREAIKKKLAERFLRGFKKDKFGKWLASDEIYFENLGIDMVVADEAHSNKNLIESVLYSDIKYLNNKYADRAVDFYFKSKIIRNKKNDQGIYYLTATPISNSPVEIFNMLLPIAEKQLESMQINNVDDFIKKFGEMDTVPTMNAGAKISQARIFKGFKNANLMRKAFFRWTDYKTADMVGAEVHFPKEKPNFIYCDQDETQKNVMKGLRLRLGIQEYRSTAEREQAVKDGYLTEQEMQELNEYDAVHKQKVDSLKGPYDEEDPKDYYFNILDDMRKATADLEWYSQAKSVWADPLPMGIELTRSPKVMQCVENVFTKHKDNAKQLIFAENVNLHDKLKDQLVKMGVPENEILIVNSGTMKSSDDRLKASDQYNAGKYKIVIGNYSTMGEGLNFQKGTSDIHHLQPAWNALAIQQGNGRGIRQGNILDEVNTHYYLTKGTVDAFFNQKILDKRSFVDELLHGSNDNFTLEEADISAEEMQIALAEDPEQARRLLQKKNEAFAKIMKERERKQNYSKLDEFFNLKNRIARMEDKTSLQYQAVEKEIKKLESHLASSPEFAYKDVLKSEERPIILPGSDQVIAIGSVIEGSDDSHAIVESYSHSTGRVTLKYFDGYGNVKQSKVDYNDFAKYMTSYMKPSEKTADDFFKYLVEDQEIARVATIESFPKDTFKKYKFQILANMQKRSIYDNIIARKEDGSYTGMYVDDALEKGYDIIFPQEREDFYNVLEQALKSRSEEGSSGYWNSERRAEDVAERVYGKNWKNKIAYLKKKAIGQPVTESDQLDYEEAA